MQLTATLLGLLGLLPLSSAQPSTSMQPLVTSTASPGTPLKVNVGSPEGGLVFQPNVVQATPGSQLEFHFYPRNHSVVQGTFATPCEPLQGDMGVYSGFVAVMHGESPTVFTMDVVDSNPVWLYCSQNEGMHCQKGMVMVMNPPTSDTETLTNYIAAAKNVPEAGSLSQVQGGQISTQSTASPTPTPTTGGFGSVYTGAATAVDFAEWGVAGVVAVVAAYLT